MRNRKLAFVGCTALLLLSRGTSNDGSTECTAAERAECTGAERAELHRRPPHRRASAPTPWLRSNEWALRSGPRMSSP